MAAPGLCVAGTYDGGIVGWEFCDDSFKTIYAYTPHQGSVRCLAVPPAGLKSGQLLVSGGTDEHIRMYDLRRRAEVGELLHHEGTITCLAFVGSTHLLSASDDGTVCIWRVYDWTLLHILGGHKGTVTSLAVHPSGKLALSSGRDRSLRMWDLVKGRSAYITRLEAVAESLRWSPGGSKYGMVLGDRRVEVRRASDNGACASLEHPMRVTALLLPLAGLAVTACDDMQLRVLDTESGEVLSSVGIGDTCGRVKEMVGLAGGSRLLSASSDGKVVLWGLQLQEGAAPRLAPLTTHSIGDGVRITCLSGWMPAEGEGEGDGAEGGTPKKKKMRKGKKRARSEHEEGGEEEGVGGEDWPSPPKSAVDHGKGEGRKPWRKGGKKGRKGGDMAQRGGSNGKAKKRKSKHGGQ